MTLEVLQKEMIAAMKAHDKLRKETVSSLIDAVKKATITKDGRIDITEDLVNRVILKEKKTMQEMIDTCPAERVETLIEYKYRMAVINQFVPQMMNEEEVRAEVQNILATLDDVQNKGAIMKTVMPVLKGKADGKLINKVVTEILSKTIQ